MGEALNWKTPLFGLEFAFRCGPKTEFRSGKPEFRSGMVNPAMDSPLAFFTWSSNIVFYRNK
ncbi:hypothetical protein U9M48_004277 [Paspalum notatum var. saurae]|uniref:Uncharacterized protein n=1 Tax=Paspalum notatum var. saurae TaxID=547442 RepID=A0AAQ3SIX6_PASNO